MATIKDVAEAFAAGRAAQCHNAKTDGQRYALHGNEICIKRGDAYHFFWCGWHTQTTANHMNHIIKAIGGNHSRVSYSQHRDQGITEFLC